jgi:hypothetical protein
VDQRDLYDDCSGFVYNSVLNGAIRWLPRKKSDRERALQYLFVGKYPIQARLIPSNVNQGAFVDFGEFIVRILNDSTGLDVVPKPFTNKGWSMIVWDQIDHVASQAFGHHGPRNEGLKKLIDRFNSFEDPKEFFHEVPPSEDPDTPGGIPILLVIVSDGELGPQKMPVQKLQAQAAHGEETKNPPSAAPLDSSAIKTSATTDLVQVNHPVRKQNLQIAKIEELLATLKTSTQSGQHEIVLDLLEQIDNDPRSHFQATKILKVLNQIRHILDPKTRQCVYDFQRKVRKFDALKDPVFVRQ